MRVRLLRKVVEKHVISDVDDDGRVMVEFSEPVNGRVVKSLTPEEINGMLYKEETAENPADMTDENSMGEQDTEREQERGTTEESAFERVPKDDEGNPQYTQTDAPTAWDAIVEQTEGDEDMARSVVDSTVRDKEAALKKLESSNPKPGATVAEKIAAAKEHKAAIEAARLELEQWKAIAEVENSRKAEAKAKAEEEEAKAKAKAEEERKSLEGVNLSEEKDENGNPLVLAKDGTTTFGEVRDESGLPAAPIKLSVGYQDKNGRGYGLTHIEANHGAQIKKAGFASVEDFISYVAQNYDENNIKVGKRRKGGSITYLLQVTDTHDNTLFIELSRDGSYWNVNSAGVFRKGYSDKKETVAKTEPQQPSNAISERASQSTDQSNGIMPASSNGKPTVSAGKVSESSETKQEKAEDSISAKVKEASADVNTEPTEAQKEAGNYKKGHVQVGTFDITIEQPEGSIRRGTDANGKKWENKMHNTYGYFRGTEGVDGDHIDVFLSNDIDGWNGRKVFVVDQYNPDGTFDEHKVMLGFNDADDAKSDYLANYAKGWENGRRIDVSAVNLEDFEKWIASSHRKTKPFSEYSSVSKETATNTPTEEEAKADASPKESKGKGKTVYSQKEFGEVDSKIRAEQKKIEEELKPLRKHEEEEIRAEFDKLLKVENPTEAQKKRVRKLQSLLNGGLEAKYEKEAERLLKERAGDLLKRKAELQDAFDVAWKAAFEEEDKRRRAFDKIYYAPSEEIRKKYWKLWSEAIGVKDRLAKKEEYDTATKKQKQAADAVMAEFRKEYNAKKEELDAGYNDAYDKYRKADLEREKSKSEEVKSKSEEAKSKSEEENGVDNAKVDAVLEALDKGDKKAAQLVSELTNKELSKVRSKAKPFSLLEEEWQRRAQNRGGVSLHDWLLENQYVEPAQRAGGTFRITDYIAPKNSEFAERLGGVLHDKSGFAAASDGRILVASKDDFDPKLKGKVVGKDGTVSESKFPDWRKVIPPAKETKSSSIDVEDLRKFVAGVLKANKHAFISLRFPDGTAGAFNANRLNLMLRAMKRQGANELLYAKDGTQLVAKSEKGAALLMGLVSAEDELVEDNGYAYPGSTVLYHRGEVVSEMSPEERVLRDAVVDRLRESGMDVITDEEEGQRVLDEANGKAKLSAKKKRALETASVTHDEKHQQTVISSADGTKVLKNLDSLVSDYEKSQHTKEKTFLGDVAKALGARRGGSASEYATFETKNGRVVTIRLSNHNATVSNFDANGETDGISIVVSPKKNAGISNDGNAHVVEYYYDAIKLRRAEGKPLADIVRSIKQALYSGEFEDTTGLAERQEVNVGTADAVRFFRTANGKAYGFTVGGKIYIDPGIANSETPIHEYAHLWAAALRGQNPKEWKNIVSLMKGTSVWDEAKKRYPELNTDDDIADEVLATYSGRRGAERLREEQRKIAEGGGSMLEKAEVVGALESVKQALRKFWKGIADFLHIHYESAEEVADRVMKDMLDGVDPRVHFDSRKNAPRFQFIGERGATAADNAEEALTRQNNLDMARRMEEAKKDAKTIKLATGWERGADGKWRYEIPDGIFHPKGDAELKKALAKQLWSEELSSLSDRILDGENLSEEETKRFNELAEKEEKFKAEYLKKEKPHLADWLENDELFKAYPELKRVGIVLTDQLPKEEGGYYDSKSNTIAVNTNFSDGIASVIAHEVQHAIQRYEGFATGGNIKTAIEYLSGNKRADVRIKQQLAYEQSQKQGLGLSREEVDSLIGHLEYEDISDDELQKQIDALCQKHNITEDQLEDIYPLTSAWQEAYNRISGEVESRNVQKRMGMSEEERRQSPAADTEDVARDSQILLFGNEGKNMRMESPKSERIEKLRESKPVEITGEEYKGKYELNRKSAKEWLKNNLRGEYIINDTGETVELRKDGIQKVTSHSMGNDAHLKSLIAIPQMIENSIFIDEVPNEKNNGKYDRYRYYVCGLKIGGVDYTAKITIGVKGGYKYYDHSLTQIEKGSLLDNIDALSTTYDDKGTTLSSVGKDSRLLSILQVKEEKTPNYIPVDARITESNYGGMVAKMRINKTKLWLWTHPRRSVPYREVFSTPTVDDYYVNTHATFAEVPLDGKTVDEKWNELKHADGVEWHKSPKSDSEYLVNRKTGDIYRKSDHWGTVATCQWDIDAGENVSGYSIGKANISEFRPWLRRVYDYVDEPRDMRAYIGSIRQTIVNYEDALQRLDMTDAARRNMERAKESMERLLTLAEERSYIAEHSDIRYREGEKKELRDGRQIEFVRKPTATYNALVKHLEGEGVKPDLHEARTGSRYMNFEKDGVEWEVRSSDHTKPGYYGEAREPAELTYYKDRQGEESMSVNVDLGTTGYGVEDMKALMEEVGKLKNDTEEAKEAFGKGVVSDEAAKRYPLLSRALGVKSETEVRVKEEARKQAEEARGQAEEEAKAKKRGAVESLSEKLHLDNVEIIDEPAKGSSPSHRERAKGFYVRSTGRITINIGNCRDVADAVATLLHEAVAHYGLRKLFGKNFDTFLDNVYNSANAEIRRIIAKHAKSRYGGDLRIATEEYLASLAERTDFENAGERNWWQKIKSGFLEMLGKIGIKGFGGVELTDNELRYMLWRSYENLKNGGKDTLLSEAGDVAMQSELGVGEFANEENTEEVNERFNEQLGGLTTDNADNVVLSLGHPSKVLLSAGVENKPMKLYGNKVIKKMRKHGFALEELRNLPRAVADPIAVFNNYGEDGNRSILTELKTRQGNFLVSVNIGKDADVDFNIITSVFGKGSGNVADWINKGYMTYVDKEKALNYLHHSALRAVTSDSSRLSSEDPAVLSHQSAPIAATAANAELSSAAKVVENFENPKPESENDILFRDGDAKDYEKVQARETYERRVNTGMFQTREAIQDSMLSLKVAMDAIEEATAGKAKRVEDYDGFENAYLGENRLSSVNQAESAAFAHLLIRPMMTEVNRLAPTAEARAELIDYMFAKHGLERNAYMRQQAAEKKLAEYKKQNPGTAKTVADFTDAEHDYAGLTTLTGEADVSAAENGG